jgi:hypothetical protein
MANSKPGTPKKKESTTKKAPASKTSTAKKAIKLGGVPNQAPVPKSSGD